MDNLTKSIETVEVTKSSYHSSEVAITTNRKIEPDWLWAELFAPLHATVRYYWAQDRNNPGIFKGLVHKLDYEYGYGGSTFDLGFKTIKGPWSGRPAVYMAQGSPDILDVTINNNHYMMSIELMREILATFNMPHEVVSVERSEEKVWEVK